MVERARVRCPVCRSAVPVTVLWAVGDTCPCCSQPLVRCSSSAQPRWRAGQGDRVGTHRIAGEPRGTGSAKAMSTVQRTRARSALPSIWQPWRGGCSGLMSPPSTKAIPMPSAGCTQSWRPAASSCIATRRSLTRGS